MAKREWGHMSPRQFKDIERAIQDIEDWWRAAQNGKSSRFHDPNEAGQLYDTVLRLQDLINQTTDAVDD